MAAGNRWIHLAKSWHVNDLVHGKTCELCVNKPPILCFNHHLMHPVWWIKQFVLWGSLSSWIMILRAWRWIFLQLERKHKMQICTQWKSYNSGICSTSPGYNGPSLLRSRWLERWHLNLCVYTCFRNIILPFCTHLYTAIKISKQGKQKNIWENGKPLKNRIWNNPNGWQCCTSSFPVQTSLGFASS